MDNSKKYQRQIVIFIEGIDGIKRHEWTHGTLYLKLEDDRDCDFIHTEIRKFYKGYIDPEGGVNMYAVGDEFAFDFVEGTKDNYVGEEPLESAVDTMLDLEADSREGK